MLESVTAALSTVIGWVGTVVTSITTSTGALYPLLGLFSIGIAISALLFGIRAIKSVIWGA